MPEFKFKSHKYLLIVAITTLAVALTACDPVEETATPGVEPSTTASATPSQTPTAEPSSTPSAGSTDNIIIGVEYVLLDNPNLIARQAEMLGAAGFHGSKPLAESIEWGAMQSGPDAEIDFRKLDNYISDFQEAGFSETTLALKSHSNWASVDYSRLKATNATPKPEYRDLYTVWVRAIVERYDADGIDDMPGLLRPVRHYEIGSEFSSFEPEPVDEYLEMLELAYAAAHDAFEDAIVSHAAFLITDLLLDDPSIEELSNDTELTRDNTHTIGDIRAILDRPDLFDVVNIHALAHPGEIEQMVRWLNLEMDARGYSKGIIISDTSPNPFISWGPANVCNLFANLMGVMVYPATEADRCRTADYFKRVLQKDSDTVEWMRGYIAGDMVKKTVIAAEQGIELINTSFTTDLPILNTGLGFAGAGNAGWGGMIVIGSGEKHANYFAMRQLIGHIDGYESIKRIDVGGPEGTRVYEIEVGTSTVWIGWYDPPELILPGDTVPSTVVTLPTGSGNVIIEPMIERVKDNEPELLIGELDHTTGLSPITLTPRPVFVSVK